MSKQCQKRPSRRKVAMMFDPLENIVDHKRENKWLKSQMIKQAEQITELQSRLDAVDEAAWDKLKVENQRLKEKHNARLALLQQILNCDNGAMCDGCVEEIKIVLKAEKGVKKDANTKGNEVFCRNGDNNRDRDNVLSIPSRMHRQDPV